MSAAIPTKSLADHLRGLPGRCPGCLFHVPSQGCHCNGETLMVAGQSKATLAHPDDRAKVDAAIRQLAATGQPFSANECRLIHGVKGGVVGAAFTAAHKAGLIKPIGDERSSSASTHGHRVFRWAGTAQEAAA